MPIRVHNLRTRKVVFGGISIVASQVLSSVLAFLLTGILSRAFTSDQFGLWSLLMTFTASFLGFDLGFGNALRNRLAQAYSKGESSEKSRGYFFSVFYVFLAFSVIVGIFLIIVNPYIPWETLLKTHDSVLVSNGSTLFILGVTITALSLGFGLNAAGFFSYQESHWNAISGFLSKLFVLVVAIILLKLGSSFFAVNLSFFLITLFISVLSFGFFLRKRNWSFTLISFETLKGNTHELWRKSVQFAALQFIAFIFVSIDLFFVSKLFGLSVVGEYSLVKKLYVMVSVFHFAFLMPIWSAYTEAAESSDFVWIRQILNKTLSYTSVIFFLAGVLICVFGEKFIFVWSGKTVGNLGIYILLGIWAFLTGITNCFSVFLNSIGKLKLQILSGVIGIVIMLPLALWWGGRFGINGICTALIISNLPIAFATFSQTRSYLRKQNATV